MDLISSLVAVCAVVVAVRQVRATDRTSKETIESQKEMTRLNLTMQLIDKYDSTPIRASRSELARQIIQRRNAITKSDVGIYMSGVEHVMDILETIGALHQRGWLDNALVYNSFSDSAAHWWLALEDYITEHRKQTPEYYDKFQYLAGYFIRQENASGQLSNEVIQRELEAFLQSEVV